MLPSDEHPPISDDESVSLVIESVVAHHKRALVRRGHLRGPGGFHKDTIVKTLPLGLFSGPEHQNRVMAAVSRSAQLSHPSIAQIYDATMGAEGGGLNIVSEWVDGYTLTAILQRSLDRSIPLPAHLIAWILKSVADALIFARDVGGAEFVSGPPHGHLHPNNIIVRVDGQVKVTDFGLAAAVGHAAYAPSGDENTDVFSYMAPEQIGSWTIGEHTDVFALGALLYQLSIGEPPFVGRSETEVCQSIQRGLAALPRQQFPDYPEALERIIVRACAVNPSLRFESVDEFRDALMSALEGDAASATRTAMAAVLSILFPEQARTHSGKWQLPNQRRKRATETPPEVEERRTWILALGAFLILSALFWLLIYPQL